MGNSEGKLHIESLQRVQSKKRTKEREKMKRKSTILIFFITKDNWYEDQPLLGY